MSPKIPTYQSSVGLTGGGVLTVPPPQMPFISAESGTIAAKAQEYATGEINKNLQQSIKQIDELGLYYKSANDITAGFKAFADTALALNQEALQAQDFDTYSKNAQKLVDTAKAGLPSIESQVLFEKHIAGYQTDIGRHVQQRLYTQGIHDQIGTVLDSLDKLSTGINDSPTPETALDLAAKGHELIKGAAANNLISADSAQKLQTLFEKKIWTNTAERRVQNDPVATLGELQSGFYNDVLDPHNVTALIDKATQRINVENRMVKMEERENEQAGKLSRQQVYNTFVSQLLNMNPEKDNPMSLLAQAEQSGMELDQINRLHRMVNDRVAHQVNVYRGMVLKTQNLPADLPSLIAKKEGVGGVNMQAYQEYLTTMDQLKGYVVKGMPVDIAGGIVQNDLKQRLLKSPLASLIGFDDSQYPAPDGFKGDKSNPQELLDYGLKVHDQAAQGLVSLYQELLVQKQITSRIGFLTKRAPKPAQPTPGPQRQEQTGESPLLVP